MNTVKENWDMTCPGCGEDCAINVVALVTVRLTHDGTDITDGNHEWDDKSDASCELCHFHGNVSNFKGT